MGVFSAMTGNKGANAHYGTHSMQTASVLTAVNDAVNPMTQINWTTDNPTVHHEVKRATLQEADAAEKEAALYEEGVKNGLRVLKAETRKQEAHTKLVGGHRRYLAATAQAHYLAAVANRGLAGKFHGLREQYAELGYGLDRKDQSATQKVELVAAKYQGVN